MLAPINAKKTTLNSGIILSIFTESKIACEWKLAIKNPANVAVIKNGQ